MNSFAWGCGLHDISHELTSKGVRVQGARDAPNLPHGYMAQHLAAKQHLQHGGKANEQVCIA